MPHFIVVKKQLSVKNYQVFFFNTGHPLFQGVSHVLSYCPIILSYLPCVLFGPSIICLGLIQSTPRDLYRRLIIIQQVIGERLLVSL